MQTPKFAIIVVLKSYSLNYLALATERFDKNFKKRWLDEKKYCLDY